MDNGTNGTHINKNGCPNPKCPANECNVCVEKWRIICAENERELVCVYCQTAVATPVDGTLEILRNARHFHDTRHFPDFGDMLQFAASEMAADPPISFRYTGTLC